MIRRFNRFELKYVVRQDVKESICEGLAENMTRDAHAGADGSYRLASLYFDSPDLTCFWAKEDGIRYRRKLRLRAYARFVEDLSEPIHAEIKQRVGKTVQKRRLTTPLETALAWIEGREDPKLSDPQDQAVAEEIVVMSKNLHLQPTCVTSYRREAWVGSEAESGLRVTFDADVGCRGPQKLLARGPAEYLFLPPDSFVMEVKVNDRVPLWITRLMANNDCSLRRVSKYCEGVRTLNGRMSDG